MQHGEVFSAKRWRSGALVREIETEHASPFASRVGRGKTNFQGGGRPTCKQGTLRTALAMMAPAAHSRMICKTHRNEERNSEPNSAAIPLDLVTVREARRKRLRLNDPFSLGNFLLPKR